MKIEFSVIFVIRNCFPENSAGERLLDVTGLVDSNGNQMVSYTYDSWGKLHSVTGTKAATLSVLNPFRYRGYVYDEETGWYYLKSRYYDPHVGRFLNADSIIPGTKMSVQGYNLYSYCLNDPVNM